MKEYYEVVAKCGHVGRGYYYEGHFYICTESKSQAASLIRKAPRVKHDHKDAILSVTQITKNDYFLGLKRKKNEAYFNCKSIQEQTPYWDKIKKNIKIEPSYLNNSDYVQNDKKRNKKPYQLYSKGYRRESNQNLRRYYGMEA